MHLAMKTRRSAGLHQSAFQEAHMVSPGVFEDGASRSLASRGKSQTMRSRALGPGEQS